MRDITEAEVDAILAGIRAYHELLFPEYEAECAKIEAQQELVQELNEILEKGSAVA